uniref:GIY-YIG domain-containing protein n=1 Tax=Panagrolaimus sp. ES5 TaxID=591445 RepID=A0AC34EZ70_9BILA
MSSNEESDVERVEEEDEYVPVIPNSNKRKPNKDSKAAPPKKSPTVDTPKAPRKPRRSKDDKGVKDVTNDSNFEEELEAHRDGTNEEKPKFTHPALIVCYYKQAKVAVAKFPEIVDWFMEFTYFKKEGIKKTRKCVSVGIQNPKIFSRVVGTKEAEWRYKESPIIEADDVPDADDRIENREYEDGTHQVQWIKQGSTFNCFDYKFNVRYEKKVDKYYGKCLECDAVWHRLEKRKWFVNGATIPKDEKTICSLKFKNGLDKDVSGCPWKPGNVAHLCLKKQHYDRLIRGDIIKERMEKSEDFIKEAIKFLEEKYSSEAAGFDVESLEEDLKKFIKRQTLVFEYQEGTKLCFLYFLFKNGVLKYIGVSTDYDNRNCNHPHGYYKDLFEGEDEVRTLIAPLGKRDEMFIKDIEAACIRIAKAGELGGDGICEVAIVNRDNGEFQSKDYVLKEIVEDPDHEDRPGLIAAMNQLLQLALKQDNIVTSSGTSVTLNIVHEKIFQNNGTIRLQDIRPAPAPLSQSQSTQSTVGPSSQSQRTIPERYTALKEFVESQSTQHPYHLDQIPWSLYILKKGKKVRYGITSNPIQRKQQHISSNTLDGDFCMFLAPLGDQNLLFMLDTEAPLIRLSKKKKLKDGTENMNKDRDNGRFSSKHDLLESRVEKEDVKLIQALNQLVKWTLDSNIKV